VAAALEKKDSRYSWYYQADSPTTVFLQKVASLNAATLIRIPDL